MWAQTWSGIMDLVNPYPYATQVDVTQSMIDKVLKLFLDFLFELRFIYTY